MTLTFTLERHQDVVEELNGRRRALAGATAPMTLGIDVSHWQGPIDFAAVKAAGFVFIVIKATEGTGYIDPNFRTYRAQAHAAGLIVLMYHFVGSSSAKRVYDATAEASHFMATVGQLRPGEGTAEDYEPANPPADPAGWSRIFLDRVATLGASPWLYMNSSTEAKVNWAAAGIPASYGLWLAKYDNDPDADAVVHWPALAAEQYWDKGTVPGIAGAVDVDVFYGTTDQLLAYCAGGEQEGLTMANIDQATAQKLVDQVGQIAAVLGDAFDLDTGDSVGDKIRRIDAAVQPIERYAADGKTIVKTPVRQEVADSKTLLIAAQGEAAGLKAAVEALAAGKDIDPAVIAATVRSAVADAIASIQTTVVVKPADAPAGA